MRPLTLTMQAFGSYGKMTTIDFTAPNQNLFLVTGDTGAGKTTIFDAIVFALYGQTSAGHNRREGMELQSQFAAPSVRPFVELKFSETVGGRRETFVVRRVPQHMRRLIRRSKANTEGLTVENESVSMIRLFAESSDEGMPVAQSRREINAKIEELIGLSKEQFMQVAMIAQGEFMDLIRADSDTKKKIFSHLFHTGIYQRIVDELAARLRQARGRNKSILEVCKSAVRQVELPEPLSEEDEAGDLIARLLGERAQIDSMEQFATVRLSIFRSGLEELIQLLRDRKKSNDASLESFMSRRDRAILEKTQAEELTALFSQKEQAMEIRKICESQKKQMQEKEELLRDLVGAVEILTVYRPARDSKKELEAAQQKIASLRAKLPALADAVKNAEKERVRLGNARSEALKRQASVKEQTDRAIAVFDRIKAALEEKKQDEKIAAKRRAEAERISRNLTRTGQEMAALQETVQKLDGSALHLERLLAEKRSEEEQRERIDGCIQDTREGILECEEAERRQRTYALARSAYCSALELYQRERTRFLDNLAGVMASELTEGKPCPVCGSLIHPHKAEPAGRGGLRTREELDAMEAEAAKRREVQSEASEEAGKALSTLFAHTRHIAEETGQLLASRREKLCDSQEQEKLPNVSQSGRALEEWPEAHFLQSAADARALLQKIGERLSAERGLWEQGAKHRADQIAAAERLAEQWKAASESLRKRQEELPKLQEANKISERMALEAETALARKEAALANERASALAYRTREEAEAAAREAAEKLREADKADRTAEEQVRFAREQYSRAGSLLQEYLGNLPALLKKYKEADSEYEAAMKERGLNEREWAGLLRDHKDAKSEIESLRLSLTKHREEMIGAERVIETTQKTIAGRKKPNLDLLAKEEASAQKAYRAAYERAGEVARILQVNENAYRLLDRTMKEGADSMQKADALNELYGSLAGKVSGARMDIETYVQRRYMERVLASANARFLDMTSGQYELRMVDLNRAGTGKNHGLDLMVYSFVTGKEREIRTLSGGESFQAALALALGMADQITANRSSIHLDMMFIDEGFGTLDDRARELAVKTLPTMAGGSRLIGIISHVTELRQEMEDQLIVTKDRNGSHVHWQIS
jgi:exonuclease SbcC